VPFVDVTASRMLEELREVLSGRGIVLFLARDVGQVRDVLRRSHPDDSAGEGRIFATVEEAVEAASKATPQGETRS
jgi:sulfate permease, SulP family